MDFWMLNQPCIPGIMSYLVMIFYPSYIFFYLIWLYLLQNIWRYFHNVYWLLIAFVYVFCVFLCYVFARWVYISFFFLKCLIEKSDLCSWEEFLIQNLMHLIVEDSSSYILILYHRFLKMLMNFKISENVDAFIF